MLYTLAFIAVVITIAMFATKKAELGFVCTIWWAIFGGHCYTLYTTAWVDIEYFMFFGAMSMAIFTAIAAFGLREKRDTFADAEMDEEKGEEEPGYLDEEAEGKKKLDAIFDTGEEGEKLSKRRQELRARAEKRKESRSGS